MGHRGTCMGYIPSAISGTCCQGAFSFVTMLKTVAGLPAVTVFSLCAQRDKPSAAKCLRKLILTDKALKLIVVDSVGGTGKDASRRFLRSILLFCCLTRWKDLPCSWLKLVVYIEAAVVKAVILEIC